MKGLIKKALRLFEWLVLPPFPTHGLDELETLSPMEAIAYGPWFWAPFF